MLPEIGCFTGWRVALAEMRQCGWVPRLSALSRDALGGSGSGWDPSCPLCWVRKQESPTGEVAALEQPQYCHERSGRAMNEIPVAVLTAQCCDRAGGVTAEGSDCPLSENLGTASV